ncbi:hypothetical protein GCM10027271_25270 [Saccharopolyspora gloriosae]|uniref:CopG family transcriptional regulator n=1 Tax=Saccharopolyspora gloriosae TaxID=455344 RepID=A0A840NNS9_9PSEU|nr:hypothetical protein [Saccharopolyspora gloriosae]MBB5071635.1 hypothetical protein [Saccharopolyspora gloriosae]
MSAGTQEQYSNQETKGHARAKRINVSISTEMANSLNKLIENEDVSLTEALRRLVGYGDFVYSAIKDDGAKVLIEKDGTTREVVIL